jgi:Zn-dependent protease/CBS domain-containing protein
VGWSWRLGRVAGIDVYVHATFALLLVYVGVVYYAPRHEWRDVLAGLAFILCLFAVIVLHELGHALTARRYGIKTRDITLLPIGGVARLERMPDDPKQELLVALAGPAVNVVLAAVLFAALVALGRGVETREQLAAQLSTAGGNLLVQLFAANVFLAVFNLLPAFPMDGGRVLRAALAMRLDYVRATRIAAGVGQWMAVAFGLFGILSGNIFLVVIALFVWTGAAAEAGMVQFKAGLAGVPVGRAMVRHFATLAPDDTLAAAARHVLDGFQHDFPVVAGGKVVGVLPRDDLLAGLTRAGPDGRVADVMRTDFRTADPREMVEPTVERLKATACPVLPVLRDGQLVGLLTADNIAELVMIREAVRGREVPALPVPVEHAGEAGGPGGSVLNPGR